VSRPCRVAPIVRRAWGFALVVGLYGAVLLGLLVSPVFMLELMKPPNAAVKERDPSDRVIFQPRGPRSGDGLPAAPVRSGVKNGAEGKSDRQRRKPVRAAAMVPLAEPLPAVDPTLEASTDLDEATVEGRDRLGDPHGPDEGRERGRPGADCLDCIGTGKPGPGLEGPDGPFGPSTPGLVPPKIIPSTRALPQYPSAARRAGLLGTVILMIVVDADGSVGQIEVLRSPDQRWGFDLSAIDAVKQWRYEPALMNGKAVAAYITVMVEFTLSR